ncbi:MAG: FtsW/RodA/SpoVE family cell cycle protein, partial [Aquiluna sp.]
KNQTNAFSLNIVIGIMVWISLQAFVNIGVVLGLFPVLGVPLPLVSAGGSSLISTMTAIGVVLAVERDRVAHLGRSR